MIGKFYYPVVFLKEDVGYTVTFPNFEYLVSSGDTEAEAFEKAEECLGMGISDYIMEGKKLPEPFKIDEISLNENEFVAVISVNMDEWMHKYEAKMVRRNITLPQWLNKLANQEKINVSQICQEAIKKALGL